MSIRPIFFEAPSDDRENGRLVSQADHTTARVNFLAISFLSSNVSTFICFADGLAIAPDMHSRESVDRAGGN